MTAIADPPPLPGRAVPLDASEICSSLIAPSSSLSDKTRVRTGIGLTRTERDGNETRGEEGEEGVDEDPSGASSEETALTREGERDTTMVVAQDSWDKERRAEVAMGVGGRSEVRSTWVSGL